jgi:hypothetical protein
MPPLAGVIFCDASKLRHFEHARQFQSKRYAKSIEKCLGFQHFLWRRTVRSGENGCATVSERLEMPAPTQAEFLLDKLLPSAKPGLPGFGYASGPLIEQQERT